MLLTDENFIKRGVTLPVVGFRNHCPERIYACGSVRKAFHLGLYTAFGVNLLAKHISPARNFLEVKQ